MKYRDTILEQLISLNNTSFNRKFHKKADSILVALRVYEKFAREKLLKKRFKVVNLIR